MPLRRLATLLACILGLGLVMPRAVLASDAAYDPLLDTAEPNDPLMTVNRHVDGFNRWLYNLAFDPALDTYQHYVPPTVRSGIANFFGNLREPFSAANSAIAGEWGLSGHYLSRFAVNSTFGLLGTLDVAAEIGIEQRQAYTFGDVLCTYEVPPGPFVVVPVLGAGNLRGVLGRVVDVATASLVIGDYTQIYVTGVYAHEYHRVRGARKNLEQTSLDPYAAVRSVVEQTGKICGPPPMVGRQAAR